MSTMQIIQLAESLPLLDRLAVNEGSAFHERRRFLSKRLLPNAMTMVNMWLEFRLKYLPNSLM